MTYNVFGRTLNLTVSLPMHITSHSRQHLSITIVSGQNRRLDMWTWNLAFVCVYVLLN